MAGKLSVYQANRVLNKLLRGDDYAVPTAYWIALFKAPSDTALRANVAVSAEEVSAVGYARQKVRDDAPLAFTESTSAASQISGAVSWPSAGAPWGTVTYAAVMDAATGGNVILYGALVTPKLVDSGDTFRLPAGMFRVTM